MSVAARITVLTFLQRSRCEAKPQEPLRQTRADIPPVEERKFSVLLPLTKVIFTDRFSWPQLGIGEKPVVMQIQGAQ